MTAPLKIGLLTPTFSGITGQDSGIGVHFRHLADGLVAAGQLVTAVVVTDKPVTVSADLRDVEVITVPRSAVARLAGRVSWQWHQWFNLRAAIAAAARGARTVRADVWETTSTGSLALRFLRTGARGPVTVRVSTTAVQLTATNAGATRWISHRIEAWERATVRRADRVFTHSALHRDVIARQFDLPPQQIPVIPHGIPLPPLVATPVVPARCRLLFVGRFEHRKGIDLLIAALPEFLAAVPHAEVTLVGADAHGYWQNRWRKTATSTTVNRVTFAGVVNAEELVTHYQSADMFVAPSRYESFGLIFIEAMSHALPVVALRAPGAMDLLQDGVTGVLIPPEDPVALARALSQVATDFDLRRRLGAAARQTVEQRYSLRALSDASLAFYHETLAATRARR